MRAKPRPLILSLALLAAVLAIPSSAVASTETLLGFGDDLKRMTRGAPAVAGTSAVTRIMVDFQGVRENGWVEVDSAVAAARSSGQRMIFSVTGLEAPDLIQWQA